jgi:hypothetical protein
MWKRRMEEFGRGNCFKKPGKANSVGPCDK